MPRFLIGIGLGFVAAIATMIFTSVWWLALIAAVITMILTWCGIIEVIFFSD